jgi:hypothetical protein
MMEDHLAHQETSLFQHFTGILLSFSPHWLVGILTFGWLDGIYEMKARQGNGLG